MGHFWLGLSFLNQSIAIRQRGLSFPFREIFSSFFFVSIGMLLNISFFFNNIGWVMLITVGVFIIKFLILVFSSGLLRFPMRTNLLSGFTLFQVGEFAFILAAVGMNYGLLADQPYQYFLSVSILTMAATPFVINYSDRLSAFMLPRKKWQQRGPWLQ
ncbi:MAG: cation:proton antiporter [Owenweeksia sp.]|nr:cation:proton antiporter [Owenweeksia sp.]